MGINQMISDYCQGPVQVKILLRELKGSNGNKKLDKYLKLYLVCQHHHTPK